MQHQTVEHLYNTILLVFTDYKPKNHDLYVLRRKVIAADVRFKVAFLLTKEEDKKRFKLLNEAYINARYKIDWSIDKKDLVALGKQAQQLQNITQKLCMERIKYIANNK